MLYPFAPFRLVALLALATGCNAIGARLRAKEGVAAYHAGNLQEAVAKFAAAAALAPENPSIQINLGFANLALYQAQPIGQAGVDASQAAISAFEHYLQLRPGEERARAYLVQTFVDSGAYDAAVDYFRPEVEKTPPSGEALATLGNIAAKTGKYEEAQTWYAHRISAEPDNADALLALGVLIWDHLHTHPQIQGEARAALADQGIETLKESIRLKPNSPSAYSYTTMLYSERSLAAKDDAQKQKDLQQARQFFTQANARSKAPQAKLAQKSSNQKTNKKKR